MIDYQAARFAWAMSGKSLAEVAARENEFDAWVKDIQAKAWEHGFFDGVDHTLWKTNFEKNPYGKAKTA